MSTSSLFEKKWVEYFVRNGWNVVGSAIISDKVLLAEINPISAYIKKALEESLVNIKSVSTSIRQQWIKFSQDSNYIH